MEQRKLKEALAESEPNAEDAAAPAPVDAARADETASDETADLGDAEVDADAEDPEKT